MVLKKIIWENVKTFHQKLMMNYLKKRGWVVFYLEPEARHCKNMCWLKLWEQEELRDRKNSD